LVLLLLAAAACGQQAQGTPISEEDPPMDTLEVTSPAFEAGGFIPDRFTCDGDEVSPPLSWSGSPERAATPVAYALIMDDPDAPGGTWVHWVAWNIDAAGLPEDVAPDASAPGLEQGANSWGRTGYGGPCPPSGTHRYVFKVYALDRRLELPADADKSALQRALRGHVLAQGELTGHYARSR
jgi:hypothetical protein